MPGAKGFAFLLEGEFSGEFHSPDRLDICQIADFAKPGKRDLLTRNVVGWLPNVLKGTLISKIL